MKVFIKAIEYYLPQHVVTNEELVRLFPEWSVDKIIAKVGVNQRHVAAENETATDMAVLAAQKLFNKNEDIMQTTKMDFNLSVKTRIAKVIVLTYLCNVLRENRIFNIKV